MHLSHQVVGLVGFLSGLIHPAQAQVDCRNSEPCSGNGPAASRNDMFKAVQHACPDGLYKNHGQYFVPAKGRRAFVEWSGGVTEQMCWEAFVQIIYQCAFGEPRDNTHFGHYKWNSVDYWAQGCAGDNANGGAGGFRLETTDSPPSFPSI